MNEYNERVDSLCMSSYENIASHIKVKNLFEEEVYTYFVHLSKLIQSKLFI